MKNQKINRLVPALALAIGSLTLAAGAQAQNAMGATSDSSLYSAGSGYVGFNAGRSRFNGPSGTGVYSNDRNGNAYSLYGGSYFNNNFGLEAGYNDFGRVNRGGGSTTANAFSLSLVGKLPVGSSFNLLGRVGGSYVRSNVSSAADSGIAAGTSNKFDLSYGLGAEFAFNPQLSAVVQYDQYNMRYVGGGRDRINATTLGLRYRF